MAQLAAAAEVELLEKQSEQQKALDDAKVGRCEVLLPLQEAKHREYQLNHTELQTLGRIQCVLGTEDEGG